MFVALRVRKLHCESRLSSASSHVIWEGYITRPRVTHECCTAEPARSSTFRANHMRTPLRTPSPRAAAAAPAEEAFAQRYLASVVADARAALPDNRERVMVPMPFLIFQSAATLLALTQFAGAAATVLGCDCWPAAASAACRAEDVQGIGCGLLGAAALRGTELWRTRSDGAQSGATADEALEWYDREPCVAHTVLVATSPLALVARAVTGDAAVGERAVSLALGAPSPYPAAALHAAGCATACAWAHGLLQSAASLRLTQLALSVAMRAMPADPDATWWWPMVASGTALAPLGALLIAATVTAAADVAVARRLRPTANQYGHTPPLAGPELGCCACSGRLAALGDDGTLSG